MKRLLSLILVFGMLAAVLAGCESVPPAPTLPEPTGSSPATEPTQPDAPTEPQEDYSDIPEGNNQLVIYWDYAGDLSTAAFWIWPENGNGQGYPVEEDEYGCKVVVNIAQDVAKVGFIACYGCSVTSGSSWIGGTKDVDKDRFVEMTDRRVTIYLKSADENIYFSKDGGSDSVAKKLSMASMVDFDTIQFNVTPAVKLTSLQQVKVYDGEREIAVSGISTLDKSAPSGQITLGEKLDISGSYELEIEGYGRKAIVPTGVFDTEEFIRDYTYDGDDLGAVIHGSATTFKVWAPTASKVVLNLYSAGNGGDVIDNVEMTKTDRGVWSYTREACGHGTYYTYTVTTAVGTQEATDPYAKAAGVNGNRSMVVDLSKTDPTGWSKDKTVELDSYTDAVIWEIHVRDFSNNISQSEYKGKYLAFTERGLVNEAGVSVGVDYLLELGITHVHLLPVYDYGSVDESNPNGSFNWGYDPKNYNVPEGSYSTDPYNGEVRIREFKQMVQSLHNVGIGVIMDVVYNHTYDANSAFNKIVPYYYYRYNADGTNTSASGCGNDTASERYMFGKFMVDSVSYWAQEYDLDGFRFDLMGLHDLQTMDRIEEAVHTINPDAILYGEGWTMGSTIDGSAQANQSNIDKIDKVSGSAGAVSVFNDTIRDGLKGSVFDVLAKGYINGSAAANLSKVQFGINGGAGSGATWRVSGAAIINYMSAHDNNTLWDKLALANADATEEERLAMNRLGAAIVMISKGTPFWQAGEEMLRSKPKAGGGFDENSYNSSDAVNNLAWEALTTDSAQYAMMRYYKGLIEMRKAYSVFRGAEDVTITFTKLDNGAMSALYEGEDGSRALVILNPDAAELSFELDGSWKLVSDGTRAGAKVLAEESGTVTVDARSARIYVG